jgi:hypothetical protein
MHTISDFYYNLRTLQAEVWGGVLAKDCEKISKV